MGGWILELCVSALIIIISPWSACLSIADKTHRGASPAWKGRYHPRNTVSFRPVETRVSPRIVGWTSPLLNGEQLRPIGTIKLLKSLKYQLNHRPSLNPRSADPHGHTHFKPKSKSLTLALRLSLQLRNGSQRMNDSNLEAVHGNPRGAGDKLQKSMSHLISKREHDSPKPENHLAVK